MSEFVSNAHFSQHEQHKAEGGIQYANLMVPTSVHASADHMKCEAGSCKSTNKRPLHPLSSKEDRDLVLLRSCGWIGARICIPARLTVSQDAVITTISAVSTFLLSQSDAVLPALLTQVGRGVYVKQLDSFLKRVPR